MTKQLPGQLPTPVVPTTCPSGHGHLLLRLPAQPVPSADANQCAPLPHVDVCGFSMVPKLLAGTLPGNVGKCRKEKEQEGKALDGILNSCWGHWDLSKHPQRD